jgi:diguanylate cyclase (GGDEF)-like protein/PAS domain S-box-containing protein
VETPEQPAPRPRATLPPAALHAGGEPYRALVEALDYGVLLYDATATVRLHNASAERVLGLNAAELLGHVPLPPGWALLYEDGTPVTRASHPVSKVLATAQVLRDLSLRVVHRDGHSSWLQATVQPLFRETGTPYAAVVSLIDTTSQRGARAQLERHVHFRSQLGTLVAASLQEGLGHTFYQHLMEGAVAAIPGAQAGSLLLRGDDGRYSFAAAVNFDQTVLARVQLHEHELYRNPEVTGPQLIHGFDNSGIVEPERREPLYEAGDTAGIKVSLSVPIEIGGQLVAYFNLDNFDDPHAFGPDATEMGQLFAHQVGALWRRFKLEADLRRERQALEHMAFFDLLTGLPNRTLLGDRLKQALLQGARTANPVALIFLDLDDFKGINDTLGHDTGDVLLQQVARRLQGCVRAGDTVARWGGDEFIVLLPQLASSEDAAEVARKILAALAAPLTLGGRELRLSASLGVSLFPEPAHDADDLIKHADIALYRVKKRGKGGFQFFAGELNARLQHRLDLEAELRRVLAEGLLRLRYRPRTHLLSGEIESFAVELSWPELEGGRGAAAAGHTRLLPLLRDPKLLTQLCAEVVRLVGERLLDWRARFGPGRGRVALEVPFELLQAELGAALMGELERRRVAPQALELSLYGNPAPTPEARQLLRTLRAAGVYLSLQGFGGPNALLGALRELPLQGLGIDASVVQDLGSGTDPLSASLVESAVLIGRSLRAQVFAEGLQTPAQRRVLERCGCTVAEGPLFGAALSEEAATALLGAGGFGRTGRPGAVSGAS